MGQESTKRFYLEKMIDYLSANLGFQPILNIFVLKL